MIKRKSFRLKLLSLSKEAKSYPLLQHLSSYFSRRCLSEPFFFLMLQKNIYHKKVPFFAKDSLQWTESLNSLNLSKNPYHQILSKAHHSKRYSCSLSQKNRGLFHLKFLKRLSLDKQFYLGSHLLRGKSSIHRPIYLTSCLSSLKQCSEFFLHITWCPYTHKPLACLTNHPLLGQLLNKEVCTYSLDKKSAIFHVEYFSKAYEVFSHLKTMHEQILSFCAKSTFKDKLNSLVELSS